MQEATAPVMPVVRAYIASKIGYALSRSKVLAATEGGRARPQVKGRRNRKERAFFPAGQASDTGVCLADNTKCFVSLAFPFSMLAGKITQVRSKIDSPFVPALPSSAVSLSLCVPPLPRLGDCTHAISSAPWVERTGAHLIEDDEKRTRRTDGRTDGRIQTTFPNPSTPPHSCLLRPPPPLLRLAPTPAAAPVLLAAAARAAPVVIVVVSHPIKKHQHTPSASPPQPQPPPPPKKKNAKKKPKKDSPGGSPPALAAAAAAAPGPTTAAGPLLFPLPLLAHLPRALVQVAAEGAGVQSSNGSGHGNGVRCGALR